MLQLIIMYLLNWFSLLTKDKIFILSDIDITNFKYRIYLFLGTYLNLLTNIGTYNIFLIDKMKGLPPSKLLLSNYNTQSKNVFSFNYVAYYVILSTT